MKAIKFFALAVMTLLVFACSGGNKDAQNDQNAQNGVSEEQFKRTGELAEKDNAVSKEQFKRAGELAEKDYNMTAEELDEAVNMMAEFYEKVTPEMVDAVKGKTPEEAEIAGKEIEKKYENFDKLYRALNANMSKFTDAQMEKLGDAASKAQKAIQEAMK